MLIEDTVAGAHLDLVTGICQRLFSKRVQPDEDFHFQVCLTIGASLYTPAA